MYCVQVVWWVAMIVRPLSTHSKISSNRSATNTFTTFKWRNLPRPFLSDVSALCVCVCVCVCVISHHATPTGVLPPAKGKNVKRLSSIIEQKTEATPTLPPAALPRTLHPAVKKEIAAFKAQWLNQVTTSVHSTLPTVEGVGVGECEGVRV